MNVGSIRLRITVLVTLAFSLVIIGAGFAFASWFEAELVAGVRSDDREEIGRQLEILESIEEIDQLDPTFVTSDDIADPDPDLADEFPLALVPDDGTEITITNADGDVLIDSNQSLAAVLPGFSAGVDIAAESQAEAMAAFGEMGAFLDAVKAQMSPESLEQFGAQISFLELAFGEFSTDDLALSENELEAERRASALVGEVFFGRSEPSGDRVGRLVTTSEQTTFLGEQLTVTAVSRVESIDLALDAVNSVLMWSIPLLIALVALLTYFATGRALQPVEEITAKVDRISTSRSGERVPVPESRDEINRLASTMNAMLDRLEAGAEGQRRFVSDVSHELRTPAAVIRAEIENGLADSNNDWSVTANSVLGEQARLSGMVDDLLLLARIDEGGPVERVEIDLDELLQREANRARPRSTDARAVEPARVLGDERKLERALQNLVSNAHRHAAERVQVSCHVEGSTAIVRVDDDGRGIPAGSRDTVFDRFVRLDEARDRDAGGSGLGLAIVREVAQAHGGRVFATNSPLGGARFELQLPVA